MDPSEVRNLYRISVPFTNARTDTCTSTSDGFVIEHGNENDLLLGNDVDNSSDIECDDTNNEKLKVSQAITACVETHDNLEDTDNDRIDSDNMPYKTQDVDYNAEPGINDSHLYDDADIHTTDVPNAADIDDIMANVNALGNDDLNELINNAIPGTIDIDNSIDGRRDNGKNDNDDMRYSNDREHGIRNSQDPATISQMIDRSNYMIGRYKTPQCLRYAYPNRTCIADYIMYNANALTRKLSASWKYQAITTDTLFDDADIVDGDAAIDNRERTLLDIYRKTFISTLAGNPRVYHNESESSNAYDSDNGDDGNLHNEPIRPPSDYTIDNNDHYARYVRPEDALAKSNIHSCIMRRYDPMFSCYVYENIYQGNNGVRKLSDIVNPYKLTGPVDMYTLTSNEINDAMMYTGDIEHRINRGAYKDVLDGSVGTLSLMTTYKRHELATAVTLTLDKLLNNTPGRMWVHKDFSLVKHRYNTVPVSITGQRYVPPVTLYTVNAHEECGMDGVSELWNNMFDMVPTNTRAHGIYGEIHSNTLLETRYFEEDEVTLSHDANIRTPRSDEMGFLCSVYTALSVKAGTKRCVSNNVCMRLMTKYVVLVAKKMLDIVKADIVHSKPGDKPTCDHYGIIDGDPYMMANLMNKIDRPKPLIYVVSILGAIIPVQFSAIKKLLNYRNSLKGYNVPTLHNLIVEYDSYLFSIWNVSICSGTLMRPIRTRSYVDDPKMENYYNQLWMDSCEYHTLAKFIGPNRLSPDKYPLEYMCTNLHIVPYVLANDAPRPMLVTTMCRQAMAQPCVSINSIVSPVRSYKPYVVSRLGSLLVDQCDSLAYKLPGIPVVCAYINLPRNTEDSIIISSNLANKGIGKYISIIKYPIPENIPRPSVGQVINRDKDPWWRCADVGVVIGISYKEAGGAYMIVHISPTDIRPGDKYATPHGQKFVVTTISPEANLPMVEFKGRMIRPEVIISSSSVIVRSTMGQVLETYASHRAGGFSFDNPRDPNIVPHIAEDDASDIDIYTDGEECTGTIHSYSGDPIMIPSATQVGGLRKAKCTVGIIQLWQLGYIARDKEHYPGEVLKKVTSKHGRAHGGAIRLSEVENYSYLSRGYTHTFQELIESSDMVAALICNRCHRQITLCLCPIRLRSVGATNDRNARFRDTTVIHVRRALLEYNHALFAYTYNNSVLARLRRLAISNGQASGGAENNNGRHSSNSLSDCEDDIEDYNDSPTSRNQDNNDNDDDPVYPFSYRMFV